MLTLLTFILRRFIGKICAIVSCHSSRSIYTEQVSLRIPISNLVHWFYCRSSCCFPTAYRQLSNVSVQSIYRETLLYELVKSFTKFSEFTFYSSSFLAWLLVLLLKYPKQVLVSPLMIGGGVNINVYKKVKHKINTKYTSTAINIY